MQCQRRCFAIPITLLIALSRAVRDGLCLSIAMVGVRVGSEGRGGAARVH